MIKNEIARAFYFWLQYVANSSVYVAWLLLHICGVS